MKVIFYWVLYPLIRPFYLISIILNTFVLAAIIIMIAPFDKTGNMVHYIGKFWSLLNIFLSGSRIRVRGKDKIQKNGTYIVMSNHQSLFDVWALIGRLPLQIRWIVKSDIRKIPLFGYALERMGHLYVDRGNREQTIRSLQDGLKNLRKGTSIVIFPEGTRSKDGKLQEFRKGGAIMAISSGIPILPVTVNGSRFVLPKDTLDLMPGKIEIVMGDLIDPSPFKREQNKELLAAVKTAITKNLDLQYGSLI